MGPISDWASSRFPPLDILQALDTRFCLLGLGLLVYQPALRRPSTSPVGSLLFLGTKGLCGESCSLETPNSLTLFSPKVLLECQHLSVFEPLIVTELSQLCIPLN